jgi:molecular chaperone GrpE
MIKMRKKKKETEPAIEITEADTPTEPVDLPETAIEFYVKTVEELSKERDEYYDSLLRKQAEFDNYRKRVNKEKVDLRTIVQVEVFSQLLPVLDSCEKGLETLPEVDGDPKLSAYREGLELLAANLESLLQRFEVTQVPGEGAIFDPHVHEAVMREEVEEGVDGQVLEVFRKGFQVKDRLIRPSQVKVAAISEPADPVEED